MKHIIKFIMLMLPITSFGVNQGDPIAKPLEVNGRWEKVTVLGVRVNDTQSGQNKVVGFECRRPFIDECLHYYVWKADGTTSGQSTHSAVTTTFYEDAPLPINMNENTIYLGWNTTNGGCIYELSTVTMDDSNPDVVIITISPGIDLP
jgi:hypothetical protein